MIACVTNAKSDVNSFPFNRIVLRVSLGALLMSHFLRHTVKEIDINISFGLFAHGMRPACSCSFLLLLLLERSAALTSMKGMAPALRLHAPDTEDAWQDVVQDLVNVGVALLDLRAATAPQESSLSSSIPASAFRSATAALGLLGAAMPDAPPAVSSTICPVIPVAADSAHATGYHRAGCLSARYNAHREGFVFSDGSDNIFAIRGCPAFATDCAALYRVLHAAADRALAAIGTHLQLPAGWFQDQWGPTVQSSQWHIKRYTKSLGDGVVPVDCLLPMHTDPSLISIVTLDRSGIQQGAAGLQYARDRKWIEVPWSGHDVAILFIGSVLQHATGGYLRACPHRVVFGTTEEPRMAATLFVRPAPEAILALPPSPVLADRMVKISSMTFNEWNAKTARNYEKAKQRQQGS